MADRIDFVGRVAVVSVVGNPSIGPDLVLPGPNVGVARYPTAFMISWLRLRHADWTAA
jgi:hypothetical protein